MEKKYTKQDVPLQSVEEPVMAYRAETKDSTHVPPHRMTKEVRASIMRAKDQYTRGEYCTQEEMNEKIGTWLD